MDQTTQAAHTIGNFLQTFITSGGLRLKFRVKVKAAKLVSTEAQESGSSSEFSSSASEGMRDLSIEFIGPDTPILIARNGEVLNALEHIATKILRLEPDQHDRVSFDADQFKANRDRQMRESALAAIERVQMSGRPHSFPPMTSRERRMLHMILSQSGLPTASSGEGPGRYVVLYPDGADTSVPMPTQAVRRPDVNAVRKAFRPR
jgi:spoIIIJ-associated protein